MMPKTIKIGGHYWKVELVDPDDIKNDCGETNQTTGIIKISKGMPKSQTEETLLHEIIHAINMDLSEGYVDMISKALYQVLKDNNLCKLFSQNHKRK